MNKIVPPKGFEDFFGLEKKSFECNFDDLINIDYKKLLIQGDVQSGKTSKLISYIKSKTEQEPSLVIFLTGLKNNLLKQNSKRFRDEFKKTNDRLGKTKYITSAKESVNEAGIIEINRMLQNGISYITSELKRPASLSNLFYLFQKINGKILIIDDEGDEASLAKNTKQKIDDLISLSNVQYISITATPYKNLYYNEDYYDYYYVFKNGEGYKGIDSYKNRYRIIDNADKESITKTIVNPLISWAHKATNNYEDKNTQILFNNSLYKDSHKRIKREIISFIKGDLLDQLLEREKIDKKIYDFLKNFNIVNDIFISNSDTDDEQTSHHEERMKNGHYIIIGGGNLSRGVTYDNLLIEVMINAPEIPDPGVLLQRARWFGYKDNYKDIEIYTTEDVIKAFDEIEDLNKWTKEHKLGSNYKEKYKKKNYRRIKL